MYVLTIKETKESVKEFNTYEEAKEFGNQLDMADRDINISYTYEILLKEDYVEQELKDLKKSFKEVVNERSDIIKEIIVDLENYKLMTDALLDIYKKYE